MHTRKFVLSSDDHLLLLNLTYTWNILHINCYILHIVPRAPVSLSLFGMLFGGKCLLQFGLSPVERELDGKWCQLSNTCQQFEGLRVESLLQFPSECDCPVYLDVVGSIQFRKWCYISDFWLWIYISFMVYLPVNTELLEYFGFNILQYVSEKK